MERIPAISKEQFEEEVLKSEIPVIVDFSTDGCGPCEMIEPVLVEIQEERVGEWKFVNLNVAYEELVEDSNEVIKEYDVMAFPTLLVFRDGKALGTLIGIYDQEDIEEKIEEALK